MPAHRHGQCGHRGRGGPQAILSVDFAHVDTILLRRVHLGGITAHPTGAWVTQQARNLLIDLGDHAEQFRFLIRDRDAKFTAAFDAVFTGADIAIIRTPVQAPRANAIAERFIGTPRRECLDHMLIPRRRHLVMVLREFIEHYNTHRSHRSLHQHPPAGPTPPPRGATVRPLRREPFLAWYTSICRSHDLTEFSAPTPCGRAAPHRIAPPREGQHVRDRAVRGHASRRVISGSPA